MNNKQAKHRGTPSLKSQSQKQKPPHSNPPMRLATTTNQSIRLKQLPYLLIKTRRILPNLVIRRRRLIPIAKPIRNPLNNLTQQVLGNAQIVAAIRE
jgi:hypothetical protein